jgi:NADPH:quinone reductase-like Zn-dependent oxidoreductase
VRAAIYRDYGPPEVLHLEDEPRPTPADDEVRIRIRAAAVNPMDYHLMGGTMVLRLMTGLRRPKPTRPGVDLSGEVDAIGRNITRFQVGDAVFGVARGAFAEYACPKEDQLALKPANATFEQAAAVPVAGLTALQALRNRGRIQSGQRVLINGSAGGVGTFAVQIAKAFGAEVTGVCSTRSVELVRSLGAHHVIDYSRDDFTRSESKYDLLLDCVGNRSLWACRRVMTPKGMFVGIGARPGGRWFGPLPRVMSVFVSGMLVTQRVILFVASVNAGDLIVMKGLIEAGKVTPVIDRGYTLSEVAVAVRHLKEGHARGKVVITLEPRATEAGRPR